MKVLLLTGSHPRHLYIVNQLIQLGCVIGHVMEIREDFVPLPPVGLEQLDRDNFIRHFVEREKSEQAFFSGNETVLDTIPTLKVNINQLNSRETIDWIKEFNADIMISYGVHKLSEELIATGAPQAWNIHGGLSPWYRGNITLFWPFYHLKPNWSGMTIHKLTTQLDAGDILHHTVPMLSYGDGIHDVACKAVRQVAADLKRILLELPLDTLIFHKQKSAGKLFVGTDWQPQHLRVIYQLFDNDIVDHFLNGKLGYYEPPLVKAFVD